MTVQVTIVDPDASDSGFRTSVRSVVYVQASEPISDVTACHMTDQSLGGTVGLGWAPLQASTGVWRIRSEHLLRSVKDVIIGYTVLTGNRKVQRFQWDGFDLEYDWDAPGADGLHLSAFQQIRKAMLSGQGADQRSRPPFGFSKS